MVSARLTSFVFGLLMFNLLALRDSFAYTHQATEKRVVEGNEVNVFATEKNILDGVPTAAEVAGSDKIGGRKMMMMKKKKDENIMNGELSSKISGATDNVGNCNNKGKRKHNIDCRLRNSSRRRHDVKLKMGSFAVLNADYHVPKSHPPKNN
ncbi:hypothetical protein LguiA_028003 [Lonicera macranthoides]